MPDKPSAPTPFGNGWSEYRRLFLMYMEEEKSWRLATEKRLAKIEQSLAIIGSQDLIGKIETLVNNSNHFGTCQQLQKKRLESIEAQIEAMRKKASEEKKAEKDHTRKIWLALITGGLALLGVILEKLL